MWREWWGGLLPFLRNEKQKFVSGKVGEGAFLMSLYWWGERRGRGTFPHVSYEGEGDFAMRETHVESRVG